MPALLIIFKQVRSAFVKENQRQAENPGRHSLKCFSDIKACLPLHVGYTRFSLIVRHVSPLDKLFYYIHQEAQ